MARMLRQLATWVRRYVAPIAISLVSVAIAAWLYTLLKLESQEFFIQQSRQASLAPADISDKIIVVTVTGKDSLKLDRIKSDGHVNHRHYARFLAGLKRQGARCVLFDFVVGQSVNPADDADMIREIRNPSSLLLTFLAEVEDYKLDPSEQLGRRYYFKPPFFLSGELPKGVEVGQGEAVDTGAAIGAIPLIVKDHKTGHDLQHIALCAFRQMSNLEASAVEDLRRADTLAVGQSSIQAGQAHEMLIDWHRQGTGIPEIGLSEALEQLARSESRFFEGKVIIIGVENDPLRETVAGEMRGTMVVAHALNTLLSREQLRPLRLDFWIVQAWALTLCLCATVALASRKRATRILVPAAIIAALILIPILLLVRTQRVLETIEPAIALGLALACGLTFRGIKPEWYPLPKAVPIVGTVMFLDIADSTGLVGKLGPNKSREVLSALLTKASRIVAAHGGEVIRDDGDGLLCLFPTSGDREHTCDCLESVEPLRKLASQSPVTYGFPITFTFGIEAGPVARDAKAIHGVTVHKAARLQGACREYKADVLVGPAAKALCEHRCTLVHVEKVTLRGIEEGTDIYRLPAQEQL